VGITNYKLQCKYHTKILGIFIFLDLIKLIKTNLHKQFVLRPEVFNRYPLQNINKLNFITLLEVVEKWRTFMIILNKYLTYNVVSNTNN